MAKLTASDLRRTAATPWLYLTASLRSEPSATWAVALALARSISSTQRTTASAVRIRRSHKPSCCWRLVWLVRSQRARHNGCLQRRRRWRRLGRDLRFWLRPTPEPADGGADYQGQPLITSTDSNIRTAVTAWFADATTAEATHGHISTWTHRRTDMSELFCGASTDPSGSGYCNTAAASFNEDIGADTSGVKRAYMFGSRFNQDIGGWAVKASRICATCSTTPRPSTRTSAGAWTTA